MLRRVSLQEMFFNQTVAAIEVPLGLIRKYAKQEVLSNKGLWKSGILHWIEWNKATQTMESCYIACPECPLIFNPWR